MRIEIRKAELSAWASILTQENMRRYYETRNIQWKPEHFKETWDAFENYYIDSQSQRVGVLRFSFDDSNFYIRDVQVEPNQQCLGIGSYCLTYAVNLAKDRGYQFIKLRVFSDNPAVSFYGRHGFKKDSDSNGLTEMSLELK